MKAVRTWTAAVVFGLLAVAGWSAAPTAEQKTAQEGGTPAAAPQADAVIEPLSAAQWGRMKAVGMVRQECPSRTEASSARSGCPIWAATAKFTEASSWSTQMWQRASPAS